jgi:tetratricopeptide (TPR) repeat protein
MISALLLVVTSSFQSARGQDVPEVSVTGGPSSPRVNTKYLKTIRSSDSRKISGGLSPAAKKRAEVEEAISVGNQAREANNYQKAFASYRKIAEELDPKDPRAFYGMGAIYFDLMCNDKAVQSFTEALRLDKDFHDALIALGYGYVAQERYDEAEAQFRAVFKKRPNDVLAKIGLAYTAAKKKQYDDAISQLNLIINTPGISKKDRAVAFLHLGNVYFAQKNWDEATSTFNKALGQDQELSAVYIRLGQVKLHQELAKFSLLAVQEMTIADRQRLITAAKSAADYFRRATDEHRYNHPIAEMFFAQALLNQFNYQEADARIKEYFRKLNELKVQSSALAVNCDAGFKELYTSGYFTLALIYNQQAIFEKNGPKRELYLAQVLENANKVVEIRENNPMAHSFLAEVYFQQGKWTEAIQHLEKAISYETNKEAQGSYFDMMGVCYEQLGNDQEALRAYKSALELRPNSTSARLSLSNIYEKNGDFDEAIRLKEEAIKLAPKPSVSLSWQLAISYFSRARAKNLDADYEKAISLLDEALRTNQSFWFAYLTLGNVYKFYKGGAYADKALANYQLAEKYVPEDPSVKFMIGDLFYSVKNNYAAAVDYIEQAIKLKPDYAAAHLLLGVVNRDKEDYIQAIGEFTIALNLDDKSLSAYTELAETYDRQKNYDEAIKVLRKAISKRPTEYMPYKELARVYSHQNRNKEAIESYESAISLMTAEPEWRRDLFRCRILRLQERYADSMTCVQNIKLPNSSETDQIYYDIGLVHVATRNKEAALLQYEQLKRMNSPLAQNLLREIVELK